MAKKSKDPAAPVHIAEQTIPAKLNKSEEIRQEARRLLDAGATPGPKIIIEQLATRGIEVVSPQVSQVLKKLGVAQRPRKKKPSSAPAPASASSTPKRAPGDESFTLHELLAAKQFVEMVGGGARAARLLDALDRIS